MGKYSAIGACRVAGRGGARAIYIPNAAAENAIPVVGRASEVAPVQPDLLHTFSSKRLFLDYCSTFGFGRGFGFPINFSELVL